MGQVGSFGAWLGQQRKARQLTQADLAAQVCYSLETIKKIEEGKRRPSRELAAAVADWLGIAPAQRAEFVQFCRDLVLEARCCSRMPFCVARQNFTTRP